MAQTGYTPISIYYSSTAGNTPTSGNLVDGELAINTADGKLFYKDSAGVVQVIAGKGGAGVAGGSNTQVQYNSSGSLAGSANLTFNGTTLTAAGLSDSGNLTFTGTGNRITGDFSSTSPASNRVAFQSSTTNGNTILSAIPNGTATQTNFVLYNNVDFANSAQLNILINASEVSIRSGISGTGTYLPLTMYTGGSERLRIDTSGRVGIGSSSIAAWSGNVLQLSTKTSFATVGSNDAQISTNGYWTGSQWSYISTAAASNYYQDVTAAPHVWRYAASGTAGNAISWSEAMRIDTSGNVGIGTSSPAVKLDVNGAINGTNITASGSLLFGANGTYAAGSLYSDSNWGMIIRAKTASPATADFSFQNSAATEKFRVTSSVLSLTGLQGIEFQATQSASSNANTLDDYEEGTFTPTVTPGTSGSITLKTTTDTLAYTKIGRMVTITGMIAVSSVSTPVGGVSIGGLPFAVGTLAEEAEGIGITIVFQDAPSYVGSILNAVADQGATALATSQTGTAVGADDQFRFSFSYFTN